MEPQRTCVGCRGTDDRSRLLRVVAGSGAIETVAVVPDPRARAAGRGAWLHLDPACLESAVKRRAFARALRVRGVADHQAVAQHVASIVSTFPNRRA